MINAVKIDNYMLCQRSFNGDRYDVTIALIEKDKVQLKQRYKGLEKEKVQKMEEQLKQCIEHNSKTEEIASCISVFDIIYSFMDGIAYS